MMTISFIPNDKGNPPGKLADAELHFTMPGTGELGGAYTRPDEVLAGLKLIGFGIWERRTATRDGMRTGRYVTFPARQYSINGERRSFALLRPHTDTDAQDRLRDWILAEYDRFLAAAEAA